MRYTQIQRIISKYKPRSIIEIGTFNGERAAQMLTKAHQYNSEVSYYGYDLFEEATPETDKAEFNVKKHNNFFIKNIWL